MPSTRRGYPYPDPLAGPRGPGAFEALAGAIDTDVAKVAADAATAAENAAQAAERARFLNGATGRATSDTDVATGSLDLGGASVTIPANVGATVTGTFAAECSTWTSLSVLTGSLRITRLSDGTAVRTEPGPVVWAPGAPVPRITLTTTWTLDPENYGRGLQLSAIKSTSGAGYRVLAGLTKITVIQHRSGTGA